MARLVTLNDLIECKGFWTRVFFWALFVVSTFGCSSNHDDLDGGDDGIESLGEECWDSGNDRESLLDALPSDRESGTDNASDAAIDAFSDFDVGENYGLWIPPGMQVCSELAFSYLPQDLSYLPVYFAVVTFHSGLVLLPKDPESFESELIESIVWQDEDHMGTPRASGKFVREGKLYSFSQDFDFYGQNLNIQVRVNFQPVSGEPEEPIIEFNPSNLLHWKLSVSAAIGEYFFYFNPCSYELYEHRINTYDLENGDSIAMELCSYCSSSMCKNSIGGIPRAVLMLGGKSQEVTSPLKLSLGFGQHDWYGAAVIVLEEPLNSVYALALSFGSYPDFPGDAVNFFGQDLKFVSTTKVVKTEKKDSW